MGWLKDFFKTPNYFTLEPEKDYSLLELIEILKTKNLTLGEGNAIVLKILEELVKKDEK